MSEFAEHAALLKGSTLFDAEWYLREYPDVAMAGIDPVEHYLRYGARMGRYPSAKFDAPRYLKTYRDLAAAGVNPLVHYLQHGAREGRKVFPMGRAGDRDVRPLPPSGRTVVKLQRGGKPVAAEPVFRDLNGAEVRLSPAPAFAAEGYQVDPVVTGPCMILPFGEEPSPAGGNWPSIGIHLHLFYADLLDEFSYFLAQVPVPFSLYVSVVDPALVARVEEQFRQHLPLAKVTVRCFENRGRDMAAFVAGFGAALMSHEWICHLHTKRSRHNSVKADWRRQLLVNLLGSAQTVGSLLRTMRDNPHVGLIFPEYHHALRQQISWGTNFGICRALAGRLGISISEDRLKLFPAGSMFWARRAALAKLLDAGIAYADFPEESGQVDGTCAHAIERLIGEVVAQSGHEILQVKAAKQHSLIFYHTPRWPYRPSPRSPRRAAVAKDLQRRKVVVYTAITGGYDQPIAPEVRDPDLEYVLFTDGPIRASAGWQVRPMDYWNPEPVRMARYLKMHPHQYFPEHDVAIWVDANVVIRGDLQKYVAMLGQTHDTPLLGVPHPLRDCAYAEADVVAQLGRDADERVRKQMDFYRADGYPKRQGLIETNFLVTDLKCAASRKILADWWGQLERFSHRDQLSLNYVLWKNQASWRALMQDRLSVRDHLDFACLGHGENSGLALPSTGALVDPYASVVPAAPSDTIAGIGVDVVICVHNALAEVRACLDAVSQALRSPDRLILVDDASDRPTGAYLDRFAAGNAAVRLVRHPAPARGYCASANAGMAATSARYVLLLNSDTVITRAALEKMLALAVGSRAGIVGPMSNAASAQSLPDITATGDQTAINDLPDGVSVGEMDAWCAGWSQPGVFPSVPLVHGFCQLIAREVIERVGPFDEAAFPKGYGEENDLCFRASDAGFDLKIATHAFVYHRKSASYTDAAVRRELMRQGSIALKQKHSPDRVARAIATMAGHPLLVRMRQQAQAAYLARAKRTGS